jgi:hypothetical protein
MRNRSIKKKAGKDDQDPCKAWRVGCKKVVKKNANKIKML